MRMRDLLSSDGAAVTMDWVIAAGAVVCLAIAVLGIARGGKTALADTSSPRQNSNEIVQADNSGETGG